MRFVSCGMTYCSDVSFETKFSERKTPHGSEYWVISRQKVESARRAGTPCADAFVALALVQAALQGVYSAALYRYATDGNVGDSFSSALLGEAFRPKK